MNIIVCIKQVPETTEVRINPETNTLIREGVKSIINPFDMYAIEEGVRLKERFGIRRACIVADRGMIAAATIADLEANGIDYILGVRERSTREVRKDVIDDDGVAVPRAGV